jgi:hypothetical protein
MLREAQLNTTGDYQMFRKGILCFLLILMACAQYAAASTVTIFNNLNGTSNGVEYTNSYLFDTFSTGNANFDLTSVTLLLQKETSTSTGTWVVYLASVDPIAKTFSLVGTVGYGSDSSLSTTGTDYTLTTSYMLSANTMYAIVLYDLTGSDPRWNWTYDTSGVGVAGEYYGWYIPSSNTLKVFPDSYGANQMSIEGIYAPEPATFFLLGGPLLVLGLMRRRFIQVGGTPVSGR